MTTNPSDALRVVVGKVSTVTDGDFLARLASGYQIAYDCADFIREHGAALAQALEDSRRINALEACVARDGGMRIHSGNYHGDFGGLVTNSRWTLRQALDVLVPAIAAQQEASNGD